jgi:hypothetical protein
LLCGWPIFKEAAENIVARRMTMELSMSIAILAAGAIREFLTALIITLFVLVAEVLENLTVARGRRAIRDLMDLLPRSIMVRRDGLVREMGPRMKWRATIRCWLIPAPWFRSTASLSKVIRSSMRRELPENQRP